MYSNQYMLSKIKLSHDSIAAVYSPPFDQTVYSDALCHSILCKKHQPDIRVDFLHCAPRETHYDVHGNDYCLVSYDKRTTASFVKKKDEEKKRKSHLINKLSSFPNNCQVWIHFWCQRGMASLSRIHTADILKKKKGGVSFKKWPRWPLLPLSVLFLIIIPLDSRTQIRQMTNCWKTLL